jgi:hypothetical protein
MMEALRSSDTSVLTRATWHNIPQDGILRFLSVTQWPEHGLTVGVNVTSWMTFLCTACVLAHIQQFWRATDVRINVTVWLVVVSICGTVLCVLEMQRELICSELWARQFEEVYLCLSPSVMEITNLRRMMLVGHVAWMKAERHACRLLMGSQKERDR